MKSKIIRRLSIISFIAASTTVAAEVNLSVDVVGLPGEACTLMLLVDADTKAATTIRAFSVNQSDLQLQQRLALGEGTYRFRAAVLMRDKPFLRVSAVASVQNVPVVTGALPTIVLRLVPVHLTFNRFMSSPGIEGYMLNLDDPTGFFAGTAVTAVLPSSSGVGDLGTGRYFSRFDRHPRGGLHARFAVASRSGESTLRPFVYVPELTQGGTIIAVIDALEAAVDQAVVNEASSLDELTAANAKRNNFRAIEDVVGLDFELAIRPTIGKTSLVPNRILMVGTDGLLRTADGDQAVCITVDGHSTPCLSSAPQEIRESPMSESNVVHEDQTKSRRFEATQVVTCIDTGIVNRIHCNAPKVDSLRVGMHVTVLPLAANTGPVSITINQLTPVVVTKNGKEPLVGGELLPGVAAQLFFDGSALQMLGTRQWTDDGSALATLPGRSLRIGSTIFISGSGDISTAINTAVSSCPNRGCVINATAYSGSTISAAATIVLDRPLTLILPAAIINSRGSPGLLISSSDVSLVGQGANSTVVAAGSSSAILVAPSGNRQLKNVLISDVGVSGSGSGVGLRLRTGAGVGTIVNSVFRNIRITGTVTAALWVGADNLADGGPTQASELVFDKVMIEGHTNGESIRCRGRFACQVTSFRDMNVSVGGSYGLHVEETTGPITIVGGGWGGKISTFYFEPSALCTFSAFGGAEAQGGAGKTVSFGPNATGPVFMLFSGGVWGSGSADAFDVSFDGSVLTTRGVTFNNARSPVIKITGSNVIWDESGSYLGNPYTTVALAADTVSNFRSRLNVRPLTFEGLGRPPDGTITPCSDCSVSADSLCSRGGQGALAIRLGSQWKCLQPINGSSLASSDRREVSDFGSRQQPPRVLKFESLPPCNESTEGSTAAIRDALPANYLEAVRGGGVAHIPVYCNGTSWVAH